MVPESTVVAVLGVLSRMERVMASRVGAGQTVAQAWDGVRWRREMRDELDATRAADLLVARVYRSIEGAHGARELHARFGRMRERLLDHIADVTSRASTVDA